MKEETRLSAEEVAKILKPVVEMKKELEEKDKEIERLRKKEKKWEKWTTEKEILSTKMSEYLCKWKNIKREYKNQVESNRLKKQEITRLNNIIDELEKYINKEFYVVGNSPNGSFYEGYDTCLIEMKEEILNKLKKLKEGKE